MPRDDPIEPVHRLKARLAEIAEPLGLTLRLFNLLVGEGPEGEPDHVQVVFTIDAETIGKDAEQIAIDRQFDEMVRDQKATEHDQAAGKVQSSLEDLAKRFGASGGFLE
jgi:hypothetical protein